MVLFEHGGDGILHVDVVLNTITAITLPLPHAALHAVHTPFRGHWLVDVETSAAELGPRWLYALTAPHPDTSAVPSVLHRVIVTPDDSRKNTTSLPTLVSPHTTSADSTSRAVTSSSYYGGEAHGLGEMLCGPDGDHTRASNGDYQTAVTAHPRAGKSQPPLMGTHIAHSNTFVLAHRVPGEKFTDDENKVHECAQLEVVDLQRQQLRHVGVPCRELQEPGRSWAGEVTHTPAALIGLHACPDGTTLTADSGGDFHVRARESRRSVKSFA